MVIRGLTETQEAKKKQTCFCLEAFALAVVTAISASHMLSAVAFFVGLPLFVLFFFWALI